MLRQAAAVPGGERHRVVQRHAGARVEPLPAAVLQRVQERHRLHQVRRQALEQQSALLERLPDQREVQHLQIAQAAVDQLARPARRAGRPVAGLDECRSTARAWRRPAPSRRRRRPPPTTRTSSSCSAIRASAEARCAGPSVAVSILASRRDAGSRLSAFPVPTIVTRVVPPGYPGLRRCVLGGGCAGAGCGAGGFPPSRPPPAFCGGTPSRVVSGRRLARCGVWAGVFLPSRPPPAFCRGDPIPGGQWSRPRAVRGWGGGFSRPPALPQPSAGGTPSRVVSDRLARCGGGRGFSRPPALPQPSAGGTPIPGGQ